MARSKELSIEQLQQALLKARRDLRYQRKKNREARHELKRKPSQSVREVVSIDKPTIIREPLPKNTVPRRTLTAAVFDAVVDYMREEVAEQLGSDEKKAA